MTKISTTLRRPYSLVGESSGLQAGVLYSLPAFCYFYKKRGITLKCIPLSNNINSGGELDYVVFLKSSEPWEKEELEGLAKYFKGVFFNEPYHQKKSILALFGRKNDRMTGMITRPEIIEAMNGRRKFTDKSVAKADPRQFWFKIDQGMLDRFAVELSLKYKI